MNIEQRRITRSFYGPVAFVALLWLIEFSEIYFNLDFTRFGVLPRTWEGLSGILTMPLIHKDYKHLFSNSIPLIILGASLIYFYRESVFKVVLLTWLLGGVWLWIGGRESYHIGASGLVYGLASFLFFSGIIRKYIRLMAISMLVVFLYGGMVWGLFPLFLGISWEAHLFGAVAGLLCAWVYRKEGPQRPVYEWEADDNEEETEISEITEVEMGNENESADTNEIPSVVKPPDIFNPEPIKIQYDYKQQTDNNIDPNKEEDDAKS